MVHVAKNEGRNQVMFNQSLSYRKVNILINQIINISGYLNMLTFYVIILNFMLATA